MSHMCVCVDATLTSTDNNSFSTFITENKYKEFSPVNERNYEYFLGRVLSVKERGE